MIINVQDPTQLITLQKSTRQFSLVFTSGCFDLLHSGHIYLLNQMRVQTPATAKLVVAIHSDAEITKHKGPQRPIFSAQHRALLLDNIKAVDYVIIWEGWENIVDLVFRLEPEFLATTADNLKRQNWANSWESVAVKINAQLIGIPRVNEDLSTTSFINKIRNAK